MDEAKTIKIDFCLSAQTVEYLVKRVRVLPRELWMECL